MRNYLPKNMAINNDIEVTDKGEIKRKLGNQRRYCEFPDWLVYISGIWKEYYGRTT